MSVREWSNRHPRISAAAAAGCVLVGVSLAFAEVLGNRRPPLGKMPMHFFSIDDGKSYFAADGANIPPFDYQGDTAVRAHVFECNDHRFVAYLERYTPDARKAEIAHTITIQQEVEGREIKRPGEAKWVSTGDHRAAGKLMMITCPDGTGSTPKPVEP